MKDILLASLCLFLIAIGSGCKKGCGSCVHGSCSGKVCNCPDPYSGNNCDTMCTLGYEGYMCATLSSSRFVGTWSCTSTSPNNTQYYLIQFVADTVYPIDIYLINFNNHRYTTLCTMTGKYQWQVAPPSQQTDTNAVNSGINGYAKLESGKMVMYIEESNVDFFATATKQ